MEQMRRIAIVFLLSILLLSPAQALFARRVVSCMPSITETLFALGLNEEIVGVTENCNYPPEARKKEKVGRFTLNLEKVVSLKPDLVFMISSAQKRDIKRFRDHGVKVETVDPHSVGDVLSMVKFLGFKTGKIKEAKQLDEKMRSEIQAVMKRYDKSRRVPLLLIVGYKPLVSVGGDTFINDIIDICGGHNLSKKAPGRYPQLSFEKLIAYDPEVLIIPHNVVPIDEILGDSRWKKLTAVKEGRILFINPDIISRPGPRVVEAIQVIADYIHEEE